ncbi:hypothetical protein JCM10450v2_000068 [Rhodotorula kratochvilovae]
MELPAAGSRAKVPPNPPASTANANASGSASTSSLTAAPEEPKPPRKKRKADLATAANAPSPSIPPLLLGVNDNAAFFTSAEGLARFCGSTSGLPLLESTRRLARTQPAATANSAEPDWAFLDQLLNAGRPASTASPDAPVTSPQGEHEFFPGRDLQPRSSFEAHNLVIEVIPTDLLGTLIHIFFEVIHPQWPILHVATFLKSTTRWREPAFAALIVSMCMLASRYCNDVRVRAEPDNATSAGYHYFKLFRRLREMASLGGDDAVEAIQSLLFAAMYNSVDLIPHPIAQDFLADAVARCYDGGLHRNMRNVAIGSAVEIEVRKRTGWACFVLDKMFASVCGRPPLMPLAYIDNDAPEPFPSTANDTPTTANAATRDLADVEAFNQLVLTAALTEKAIDASMHPPTFENSPFLDCLGGRKDFTAEHDFSRLAVVDKALDDWVKQLPPALAERDADVRARLPDFSPRNEAVIQAEECCRIMLASRRLQLTTAQLTNAAKTGEQTAELRVDLRKNRQQLLATIKRLISSGVKLGAAGILWRCDIFVGYRLLMAGRLTLAVVLSAQEDADGTTEVQALHTLEACLLLLKHFAIAFPTSLGAAETLKETCRVCNVNLSKTALEGSSHGRYAWHRPLARGGIDAIKPPAASASPSRPSDGEAAFSANLHSAAPPPFPAHAPAPGPPAHGQTGFTPPAPFGLSPASSSGAGAGAYHALAGLGASPAAGGGGGTGAAAAGHAQMPTPGASGLLGAPSPDAWSALLAAGGGEMGSGGGGLGMTPSAFGSGAGMGMGFGMGVDVQDFSWLYPGGHMPLPE